MAENRKEKTLAYARRCVKRNQEARKPLEWRWYENAAFAAGYTNVEYDPRRRRPISLGSASEESSNPQVQDKLRKYHAKLSSSRLMPECVPRRTDRESRKRADIANALIIHFWEKQGWVYSRHSAMLNMMVFGNGIWAMQWDEHTGDWVEEILYNQGEPLYEDHLSPGIGPDNEPLLVDIPPERIREVKVSSYRTGLPHMRSVHPFNFFPDPHWRHLTVDQCLNYAERKTIPLDMLEHFYPDVEMDRVRSVESGEDAFLFRELDSTFGLRGEGSSFDSNQAVEVFDFHHGPIVSRKHGLNYPRGFRCVYVGDQLVDLVDGLPYNEFPHATFRDRQYTDRGWGLCVVDVLKSAQKRLDLVERIEIRAAERCADPPLLKPAGSTDSSFQGRPGEIYEYIPYGEEKPSYMMPPEIPRHIYQMRTDAMADLDALSLTSSPVGGSTPARGDSGAYLDRLLEENQIAMAPTIQEIELSQAHMASHLVRLSQDHLPVGFCFALVGRDRMTSVVEFDGRPFNLLEVRMVPGSAAATYPNQIRSSVMQLAANGMLAEDSPKAHAIIELLLGAPVASQLTDLQEPGDKAVAEINIQRIINDEEPFFKSWMEHSRHIEVLLMNMRDPRYFLDFTIDQQGRLEQLLQQHQAAIAPNPEMGIPGGAPQQGGGGEPAGAPKGPAQVPAAASGYTGPLGVVPQGE